MAAGIVASIIVSAGGWELSVPATIGSEAGRAVSQIGQGAPLDDFRVPAAFLVIMNAPLWLGLVGAPLWARSRGLDWKRDLGWSMTKLDVPVGLGIGVAAQFALIPLYELIFVVFEPQDVGAPARSLVLVDHARRKGRDKRTPRGERRLLDVMVGAVEDRAHDLLALDEALDRLAAFDPQLERLVDLRFFAGLTVEQTAAVLEMSPRQAAREWETARAWLRRELS